MSHLFARPQTVGRSSGIHKLGNIIFYAQPPPKGDSSPAVCTNDAVQHGYKEIENKNHDGQKFFVPENHNKNILIIILLVSIVKKLKVKISHGIGDSTREIFIDEDGCNG
jgi:hypothetical protein